VANIPLPYGFSGIHGSSNGRAAVFHIPVTGNASTWYDNARKQILPPSPGICEEKSMAVYVCRYCSAFLIKLQGTWVDKDTLDAMCPSTSGARGRAHSPSK